MSTVSNNSSNKGNFPEFSIIPLDTIPALVFMVFILVINTCVVLLISCYSNLKTTSNIILASLGVSDFLVGFVGIPLLVACSSTFLSPVCVSSYTFFTFMSMSTVLHITVMTCDRYIYIIWALRYDTIVQTKRVLTVLGLTWFISLTSLVRLSWTWNLNMNKAKEELALVWEEEATYLSFKFIAFFFIPLIVMSVLDARMLLLLRRQCQRIAKENLPAEFIKRERKMQMRQRRAVITCVLLLTLYVIFWLPFFVLELIHHHFGDRFGAPQPVTLTIYYLRLCPSLFNPLIYTLRKHDLKKALKGICRKVFPCYRGYLSRREPEQIPLSCPTYV